MRRLSADLGKRKRSAYLRLIERGFFYLLIESFGDGFALENTVLAEQ